MSLTRPVQPAASEDRWARLAPAALAVLGFVVLLPVMMVEILPMLDYPNHLARMYLLANLGTDEALQRFYEVRWHLFPNLAMDLVVPLAARLVGAILAMKLFLLAGLVLVVTGSMAIEWALKRRLGFAGVAALLFIYNSVFVLGFINFTFGLGIALWGVAGWIGWRDRGMPVRLGLHAFFVLTLFVCHLYTLGIYGVAISGYEAWRLVSRPFRFRAAVTDALALGAPFLVPLTLLLSHTAALGDTAINKWEFANKIAQLTTFMGAYYNWLALGKLLVLLALAGWLWWRGCMKIHPAGIWIGAIFAILFMAMPSMLFDTAFADIRISAGLVFLLPGFLTWSLPAGRARGVALTVVAVLLTANVATVAWVWIIYQRDYREMIASFDLIPRGSKILVGSFDPPGGRRGGQTILYPISHAPVMAVMFSSSFVPTLFTHPGKQVVTVRPELRDIDTPEGSPVPTSDLIAAAGSAGQPDRPKAFYWQNWTKDFDYLYVLVPEGSGNPLPSMLRKVASGRLFDLYKIVSARVD